ncbi:MAG: PAS domain-containing sensor histidine kinase [Methanoregula sp.]|nr:PAS domain-containing sensor histidine kinase [Methanoregula sp.]
MARYVSLSQINISHTDLVRLIVIFSLTLCCIAITVVSLKGNIVNISAQLFFFPLLYATYFYPRWGVFLAGFCAVAYEILAYVNLFPDTGLLIYATGQAILFICITVVVAHFTEKVNRSEARYRSIFETSLLGIVLFDQNSFAIRMTNNYLSQMLGYTPEEFTSMTLPRLFVSKDDQRRFFEYLGSSEDVINFETQFISKDKEPLWVNLSWRRVSDNLVSCSVIDINKRKRLEQAAEENYIRYQQVTESSPTCIIITSNQKIAYTNPAFQNFSGYDADELAGQDLLMFIHNDDRADFLNIPAQLENPDGKNNKVEYRFLSKNGEIRLAAAFFSPIQQKGETSLLINLVDITEKEQLKEDIEQVNERSRGLISTVADELRTPLQPIMGYLNLLTGDPQAYGVTEETRVILDRCAKSVDHERQIINQMLELSVLDAGKIPLNYSTFSPERMVQSIINAGGYATKANLTIDIPSNLTFEADPGKISTVIESMLSNAVNYSKPPRKIRISYQSGTSDKMHRISIQDNGIGITNTQLDEIFEPFKLPDSGNISRKYDRIGLSLSIAKKYIQMHGGYISVDSIVNLGSTFTIHLPKTRSLAVKTNDA